MVYATSRTLRTGIGVFALVVGAEDDRASAPYRHLGSAPIGSDRTLALPVATIREALA